jgi:hypothetical protein|tara:strand:- start:2347 stop:2490 length:144 start_codon:yes stop_codon:yes gene_type:complete
MTNNEKKYRIDYRRTYMSDCYHVNGSVVFECDEKKYRIDHKVFKKRK